MKIYDNTIPVRLELLTVHEYQLLDWIAVVDTVFRSDVADLINQK